MSDNSVEMSKMPLLDHLIELRQRLLYSVLALFGAFIVCFFFAQPIYDFLNKPLADILLEMGASQDQSRRMIATDLDGTLIGRSNEFGLYNAFREKINTLRREHDAVWVICTGRSSSHRRLSTRMVGYPLTPSTRSPALTHKSTQWAGHPGRKRTWAWDRRHWPA